MIYAIGDIHGQHLMLRLLLERLHALPLRDEDTLVFLGDYIDRGDNSCGAIETLLSVRDAHSNVIFLRGNHEQLMLNARAGAAPEMGEEPDTFLLSDDMLLWLQNGGMETLNSYQPGLAGEAFLRWWDVVPECHWQFIEATEMEYVTDQFHFVHAGLLPPGMTWEGAPLGLDPRLWIREPFLSCRTDFGRIVVFGHTPQRSGRPLFGRGKIGLDTGAVFGGPLTAAAFDPAAHGRRLLLPRIYQIDQRTARSAA